jgi:protein-disulfide isomerase
VAAATIAKDYTLASPFVASCALEQLSRASVPAPARESEVVTVSIYFNRGESGGEPSVRISGASSGSAQVAESPQAAPAQTVEVGNAPSRGPSDATVTVVEFTDPECPFCGRAHESINALYKELGDRVRFVLKFSPMSNHRRAPGAAAAALAAAEQGKFWEYVDALYAHPDALDRAGLERMAAHLGLDQGEFTDALDSQRFASAIEADQTQAKSLGVKGVPTFYINGRVLIGARPIDDMRAMILEALNERR